MATRNISRVCVFCGSNRGQREEYHRVAGRLGKLLAERQIALVYGGGRVGLMGVVADAALESGGEVIGVIPHALNTRELAHEGISQMHTVDTMHERKALMADLADAFIALPGGFGTFDEFFEIITWAQLGIHHKPCGVLNIGGYFDRLVDFVDHAVGEGFIQAQHRKLILVGNDAAELLDQMVGYVSPIGETWVRRSEL